jgi:hypothetical protein
MHFPNHVTVRPLSVYVYVKYAVFLFRRVTAISAPFAPKLTFTIEGVVLWAP